MRSVSQAFSQTFLLIAFSLMPLAARPAINFSAPLFATLVSALLLKEGRPDALERAARRLHRRADRHQPGRRTFQIGALFALGNAVLYGSVTAARARHDRDQVGRDVDASTSSPCSTGLFALFLPFGWTTPTPADAG